MNEKELGDALLKWNTSQESLMRGPRELTAEVLERDRRRVRRLAMVSGALWLLALAGILLIFIAGGFAFPYIAKVLQQNPALDVGGEQGPFRALAKITAMNIVVTSLSLISLVCAGLGTLVLVRASRQATVRQVNAGLVEISEQLKQLRAALGK